MNGVKRVSEAVVSLRYKTVNLDEYTKFRQSILDLKKPVKDVGTEMDKINNKSFNSLATSARSAATSLSAMQTRLRSINDYLNKIRSKRLTISVNGNVASNTIRSIQHAMTQLGPHAAALSTAITKVGQAFSLMGTRARAVLNMIHREVAKIINMMDKFGKVIHIRGVATLRTANFLAKLEELVKKAEEAGRRIRAALDIGGGGHGGGGGGPNPPPPAGGGNGSGQGNGENQSVGFAKKMMAGFAAFTVGKDLIEEAVALRDEWVSSMNTLKFITGGIEKAKEAQTGLLEVSRETHSSYEATRDLFVSFQQIADKTKLSIQDNIALTKTVQAAAKLGGGGSEQNKLAITQLEQAIKKGKMDQQDLHSIEQFSPGITSAMAKGLDISVAELRNKVHKGLDAESIIKSFQKVGPEIAKLNAEADLTLGNIKEYAHSVFFEIVGDVVQAGDGMKTVYQVILKGLEALRSGWKTAFGALSDWLGSSKAAAEYVQIALASLGGGTVIAGLIALGSALAVAFWPVTLAVGSVFALLVAFKEMKKWVDGNGGLFQRMFGDFTTVANTFKPYMERIKAMWQSSVDAMIQMWSPLKGILYNIYNIVKSLVTAVAEVFVGLIAGIGDLFGMSGEGTPLEKSFNTLSAFAEKFKEGLIEVIKVVQNLTSFLANMFRGDEGELVRKLQKLGLTIEAVIQNWLDIAFLKIKRMFVDESDTKTRNAIDAAIDQISNRNLNDQAVSLGAQRGMDVRDTSQVAADNLNNPVLKAKFGEMAEANAELETTSAKLNAMLDEIDSNNGKSTKYTEQDVEALAEKKSNILSRMENLQSQLGYMAKDPGSTFEAAKRNYTLDQLPRVDYGAATLAARGGMPLMMTANRGQDALDKGKVIIRNVGDSLLQGGKDMGKVLNNTEGLKQSSQSINQNLSTNFAPITTLNTTNNFTVTGLPDFDTVLSNWGKNTAVRLGDSIESGMRSAHLGWMLPKEDKSGSNVERFDRFLGISPTEATGR